MGFWPPRSTWGAGLAGGMDEGEREKGPKAARVFLGGGGGGGGLAAGSRGRRPARGKDFLGDTCDPGTELVLGLNPLCSKREEEEAEKDFGAREGLSPCPASPGDAWGTGSAGEQRRSWGAPVGERPPTPSPRDGRNGFFWGGHTKKPSEVQQQRAKSKCSAREWERGRAGKPGGKREWEKEWDGGEKKGDQRGSGMGYTHAQACWYTSGPAGVRHSRGAPPINHRNKRVRACCSLPTADSAAGMGEDCNN